VNMIRLEQQMKLRGLHEWYMQCGRLQLIIQWRQAGHYSGSTGSSSESGQVSSSWLARSAGWFARRFGL
jgi:hypothetical protein